MPLNGSKVTRYKFTIAMTIIAVAVIFGFFRVEHVSHDQGEQVKINTEQGQRLEGVIKGLEEETRVRTTENCLNQAASRESLRKAFLDVLNSFPPSDRLQAIIDTVNKSLPPLACPQDSTVVIPQPQGG